MHETNDNIVTPRECNNNNDNPKMMHELLKKYDNSDTKDEVHQLFIVHIHDIQKLNN